MKFFNNQKTMLVGFGLILGFILLVLAQSVAAETRVSVWGRDIIVADDDRIVLQMDGTNYLLPRDADKVPAVPQEGYVTLLFGAAGQFANMAESHVSKHHFETSPFSDESVVTGCLLKNEIVREYTTEADKPKYAGYWPLNLTRSEVDYVNGCGVLMLSLQEKTKKQIETWPTNNSEIAEKLNRLESPSWLEHLSTKELTLEEARSQILVHGEPIDGRYFLTEFFSVLDQISILVDYSGDFLGPSPVLIVCSGGFGTSRVYQNRCQLHPYPIGNWVRSTIRFGCACAHSFEYLKKIDEVVSDRLRYFLTVEDQ